MIRRIATLVLGVVASTGAFAAPSIALTSGTPANFNLAGEQFTNDFYIDVGPQSRLQLTLSTTDATADLDVLLRYGSPFPDQTFTLLQPTYEYLFEFAQYRSTSSDGSESIDISTYNHQPVRPGRWYVSVLNFTNRGVPATLTARLSNDPTPPVPIEFVYTDPTDDCGLAPWTDSTSRAPIAGNNGTTLGAQRKNAMAEAARIIGQEIKSPVPLRVQACWEDLGVDDGNGVTLASASPYGFFVNDASFASDEGAADTGGVAPWLGRNYTWYASGPASKLAGSRLCESVGGCEGNYDLRIQFNSKIDTSEALGTRGYHYGITSGSTNGDVDFIAVAMHEMLHGFGFAALINKRSENGPIGKRLATYDDAYSAQISRFVNCDNIATGCQPVPFLDGPDELRATAMTSGNGLRFNDAVAAASEFNTFKDFPPPLNLPILFAPDPIQSGSTLSHLGNAKAPGNLMLPQVGSTAVRQVGLAAPMLERIGWSDVAATPPAVIEPFSAQYFDVTRAGHGIDFSRVAGNIYTMVLYTYGANGEPEWYIAAGPLVDGVFRPAPNANGDSLVKFKYVAGATPPQQPDASVSGNVRLDFNGAAANPVCNDGVARDLGGRTAVMTWSIGNDRNKQWCMQPVIPDSVRTTPDWTGGWASSTASDSGWGFSLLGFGNLFSGLVYYPDAEGNGRWAYMQEATFASGTQYKLRERRGYCRTCPTPAGVAAGQFDDVDAGTITIDRTSPNAGTNKVNFSVTYQRPPGGSFTRNTTIVPLTETRQ